MTIELITGNPGAGKTTYAVAERVAKEVEREFDFEINGQAEKVKRRVLVAGIGGLLVEHERLPHTLTGDHQSQKVIDYFNEVDADGDAIHRRLRGEDPVDIPATVNIGGRELAAGPSLFNWWLWCRPGDLIVVDEIQYIVPRGTLGRKPPPYIALLEIHRHYGVDFLIITQHPQLLDTTIRNLVGMHRHVRSVMGSRVCVVYSWDHASNPERFSLATKSQFVRRDSHYALFKSAAAHVSPPKTGRAVLWLAPLLLLAAGGLYYRVAGHAHKPAPVKPAQPAPSAAPSVDGGPDAAPGGLSLPGLSTPAAPGVAGGKAAALWPVYHPEKYRVGREPLDGRAVQWEGGYVEGKSQVGYFGVFVDGERVATVTLAQLVAMGYQWTTWGPCVGSLRFAQFERLVTCGKAAEVKKLDASKAPPVDLSVPAHVPTAPGDGNA